MPSNDPIALKNTIVLPDMYARSTQMVVANESPSIGALFKFKFAVDKNIGPVAPVGPVGPAPVLAFTSDTDAGVPAGPVGPVIPQQGFLLLLRDCP
jgi:hypothetical protein